MSAAAPAIPHNGSFALRRTQLFTILRAELSRNFITKRGFWIYLLAFAPAVIVWIHSWVTMTRGARASHDLAKDTQILSAAVYGRHGIVPRQDQTDSHPVILGVLQSSKPAD